MDMPMKEEKKSNYFKCPNCDAELCATKMEEEKGEMGSKPMPKSNAARMPMNELKSKISSGPTMNMNSY